MGREPYRVVVSTAAFHARVQGSASDRQGSNFESCVWRTVSSQSSHHPQEALLAQFSLYVHKGGLKPDSFHFISGWLEAGQSGEWSCACLIGKNSNCIFFILQSLYRHKIRCSSRLEEHLVTDLGGSTRPRLLPPPPPLEMTIKSEFWQFFY